MSSPFVIRCSREIFSRSEIEILEDHGARLERLADSRSDEIMQYTIVIGETPRNFSAYAPDLPGCVATGATRDEVVREMRSAIAFHIESLHAHREPVPDPRCTATVVDVAAAV